MDRNTFKTWFKALGNAWITLDPKAAANICAEDVAYYEKLFHEPLRSPKEVENQWEKDLKYQKDVKFDSEIVAIDNNVGVARFWATFTIINPENNAETTYSCDGIFLVELDESGLCKKFEQWPIYKD